VPARPSGQAARSTHSVTAPVRLTRRLPFLSLVLHDPEEDTVKELQKLNKSLEKIASEARTMRERGQDSPWRCERRVRRLPDRLRGPARRALGALGLLRDY